MARLFPGERHLDWPRRCRTSGSSSAADPAERPAAIRDFGCTYSLMAMLEVSFGSLLAAQIVGVVGLLRRGSERTFVTAMLLLALIPAAVVGVVWF